MYENSVGLSSTINPQPIKGATILLPAQVNPLNIALLIYQNPSERQLLTGNT